MSEAVITKIEEALHTSVTAFNVGNMADFLPYIHPEGSAFWPDEGDLVVAGDVHDRYRVGAKNGFRANLQAQDINVQIYGDIALITCYFRGTFNPLNSEARAVVFRVSQIWETKNDQWQVIHAHYSPHTLDS